MPGVPVVLGGQTRHLLYDLNALCTLKAHGINLLAPSDGDTEDPVVLRALLWAGFLHESPDLAVETVGRWVTMDRIGELAETFATALHASVTPASPDARDAIATASASASASASGGTSPPTREAVTGGATVTASATDSSA